MRAARFATVSGWAAAATWTTIALGSMVCATDSSAACPAWPVCYPDRVGPALSPGLLENPVIEFVHRAISFAALVLLGYAGWLGRESRDRRVRVYPCIALGLAIASAVFGMMIILFTLPLALGLIDLGGALVALVLITVAAQSGSARTADVPRVRVPGLAAITTIITMHLLGIVVAGTTADGTGSFTRCIGWPLWQIVAVDRYDGLQVLRSGLGVVAGLLLVLVVARGWTRPGLRLPAALTGLLFATELALGLIIGSQGLDAGQTNGINQALAVAYAVVAVALLGALALLVGRTVPAAPGHDSAGPARREQVPAR